MMVQIPTNRIVPHPDNPRKHLGDLSELKESIKTQGILQNLTVVRRAGDTINFTCVIGHRRLAAAILAGLDTVPCQVVEMSAMEQLATMMTENMQRNDLTVWEQAKGFQMMMDLGESVAKISERTGLSETTVRRRTRLAALDDKLFQQAEARGATMKDYLELEQIEDPALKNKVLAAIGTHNFAYELSSALRAESLAKAQRLWRPVLDAFATEIKEVDRQKHRFITSIPYDRDPNEYTVPDDLETASYYYQMTLWIVDLYTDRVQASTADDGETLRRRDELTARVKQLEELTEQAADLRQRFIDGYRPNLESRPIILRFLLENILNQDDWLNPDASVFRRVLDIRPRQDDEEEDGPAMDKQSMNEALSRPIDALLWALAWATKPDLSSPGYCNRWDGKCVDNEELDREYAFLWSLGYRMSDAERQLQNGSHPLLTAQEAASEDEEEAS